MFAAVEVSVALNMFKAEDVTVRAASFPHFLTDQYFECLMQKHLRDSLLKVTSVHIISYDKAFCSGMMQVQVYFEKEHKSCRESLILKTVHKSELAKELLGKNSYNVHEKEMEFYENVAPEFERILKSVLQKENIFPKVVAVDRLNNMIVLEDLGDKKFFTADRFEDLNSERIKISFAKLAKFHAASLLVLENYPSAFKYFDVGFFSRKVSAFHDKLNTCMGALIAEVSSWEGYEKYSTKLERVKGNLFENSYDVFDNKFGDLKVLVHGDFWFYNMMFKTDDNGALSDAVMVRQKEFKRKN